MNKHDPRIPREMTLSDQVDQPRCPFGRIDRVEQDSLQFREQPDRLQRAFGRDAVARTHVIGVGNHVLTLDDPGAPKLLRCRAGRGEDILFLLWLRRSTPPMSRRQHSM